MDYIQNHPVSPMAQRVVDAAEAYDWREKVEPRMGELYLLDAVQWLVGIDLGDGISECLDELGLDENGFPVDGFGNIVGGDDAESEWIRLGPVE